LNDWQDYNLARAGDRSAWMRLVKHHVGHLTRLAAMITGSAELAQDVVQDVMIQLFNRPPKHQQGSLGGWLATVTYHQALREKQRGRTWMNLGESDVPDPNPSPLTQLITNDRDERLFEMIRSLDEPHRSVIMLRFYSELSLQEIATTLNIPLGTVKSRLFNAVKQCRKQMKEKGLT